MCSNIEKYHHTLAICSGLTSATLRVAVKYTHCELAELLCTNIAELVRKKQEKIVTGNSMLLRLHMDHAEGYTPLVVNAGCDQACGEWDIGAAGDEEQLCYSSTLCMSLVDALYPLVDACVYSPSVWVFRDDRGAKKSINVSVLTVVPPARADIAVENDRLKLEQRLEMPFMVATLHHHTSIIFNEWGLREDNNAADIVELMRAYMDKYPMVQRCTVVCGTALLLFKRLN